MNLLYWVMCVMVNIALMSCSTVITHTWEDYILAGIFTYIKEQIIF